METPNRWMENLLSLLEPKQENKIIKLSNKGTIKFEGTKKKLKLAKSTNKLDNRYRYSYLHQQRETITDFEKQYFPAQPKRK